LASPLDIIKEDNTPRLPRTIELANNLFQAFIKNNSLIGLKLAIVLSGAKKHIEYDTENRVFLEVDNLCKIIKCTRKELSNNLKKATSVSFSYVNSEGGHGHTHPIHSYEYVKKNKYLVLEVSSRAKELFISLGKGAYSFSDANANNLMGLKHKHSLRMQLLLEQINSFSDDVAKRKRYTLEELNGYFGTNYSRYIDLKRKILDPVKKEIDFSSSLTFEYEMSEELSSGKRKIKEVVIDIKENNNLFTQAPKKDKR
jgi:plasmid replication initiation protein